jgi:hypothetical protein
MVKGVPMPFQLQVLVKIQQKYADHIDWIRGALRPIGKHSLQAGDDDGVAVGQADGIVMKSGDALMAIRLGDGMYAALPELFGNLVDVRLTDRIACEIYFAQHLKPAILLIDAPAQYQESASGKHTGERALMQRQVPDQIAVQIGGHGALIRPFNAVDQERLGRR